MPNSEQDAADENNPVDGPAICGCTLDVGYVGFSGLSFRAHRLQPLGGQEKQSATRRDRAALGYNGNKIERLYLFLST